MLPQAWLSGGDDREDRRHRKEAEKRHAQIVWGAFVLVAMLSVALVATSPAWADECSMTHDERKPLVRRWWISGKALLYASQLFIAACLLVCVRCGGARVLYHTACLLIYFNATALVVVALKQLLGDSLCNIHANSVSGHAHFYLFFAVALPSPALTAAVAGRAVARLWVAFYALYLLALLSQGYRTVAFGFHSPRQFLYGALSAALSSVAWQLVGPARWFSRQLLLGLAVPVFAACWCLAVAVSGGFDFVRSSVHLPAFIPLAVVAVYTRPPAGHGYPVIRVRDEPFLLTSPMHA
ncbi:hypothetical protein DIPPA_22192 [Diplonema papillatum]|nr:hypothetical protein DIPPA_22192 [Diplonema papillatum]